MGACLCLLPLFCLGTHAPKAYGSRFVYLWFCVSVCVYLYVCNSDFSKIAKNQALVNGPQQHSRCANHAITRKQGFNSDTINFEILAHCACSAHASTKFLAYFEKSELQTHRNTDRHTNWLLHAFSACTPRNNNLLLIIISFSSSLTHSLSLVETRSPPCLLLPWSLLLSVYAMLSSFFRPHQQLLLLSLSLPSSQMKALEMASTICLYGLCLVLLFKGIVYLFSGERGSERGRSWVR